MIQEALFIWQFQDTECGLILPWFTKPALQWLKSQDVSQWRVREYGSGYSTIWFRANCKDIEAVESNRIWAEAMNAHFFELPEEKEIYIRYGMGSWDCIVVDGDYREECVKFVFENNYMLVNGGFLIIDNYGQEDFPQEAVDRTEELLKDWKKQIFKQPNHTSWKTAVFTKP